MNLKLPVSNSVGTYALKNINTRALYVSVLKKTNTVALYNDLSSALVNTTTFVNKIITYSKIPGGSSCVKHASFKSANYF